MSNVRIIIVEDEHSFAKMLKYDLTSMGMEVVGVFRDLASFNKGYPGLVFDLAIVDLQLDRSDDRNRSGWKIVERISQLGNRPVIIHSSHSRDEIMQRIDKMPTVSLIKKVTGRSELMTGITRALMDVHGYHGLKNFNIDHLDKGEQALRELSPEFFSVKNQETGMTERIWVKEVIYVSSLDVRGLRIYHNRGIHESNKPLSSFLAKLKHPDLLHIHQSYVVNRTRIDSYCATAVVVTYGGKPVRLPVSRSKGSDIANYMNSIEG